MKRRWSMDSSIEPLHLISQKKRMAHTDNKVDLFQFSQEKCEFCDKLSFCIYDQLRHNAKHIIIPLKDELVKCDQCNHHFANEKDLEIHTKVYHFEVPDILLSIVLNEPIVKCDNSVTELVTQSNEKKLEKIVHKQAIVKCDSTVTDLINENNMEKLKDFVVKQPIIRCEDTIKSLLNENIKESEFIVSAPKQNLVNSTKNDKKKHELVNNNDKSRKLKENNISDKKIIKNNTNKELPPQCNNELNVSTNNIKSRLVFEDYDSDFEDDIISTRENGTASDFGIKKLPEECLVERTMSVKSHINERQLVHDPIICDLTLDDSDDDLKYSQTLRSSRETVCNEEIISASVHYDDLTDQSRQKCRRCNLSFLNMYDLITHETKIHFKLKKRSIFRRTQVCAFCDKYIAGNYRTLQCHIEDKHPNCGIAKYKTLKKCNKCKLKYYCYPRHCSNYHDIYKCSLCHVWFDNEAFLTEHVISCKGRVHSFPHAFEDRIGVEKIIKVCELCCLFFKNTQTYKYVPMGDYSEKGKRIVCERCEKQFFEVTLIKLINKHPIVQPEYQRKNMPTTLSNEKRLKKIQRRLKFMNQIFK